MKSSEPPWRFFGMFQGVEALTSPWRVRFGPIAWALLAAFGSVTLLSGCSDWTPGAGEDDGSDVASPAWASEQEFSLPWTEGESWFLVGGPHCDSLWHLGGNCGGQQRYALDFAPVAPMSGNACRPSSLEPYWVTAASPGVVRVADRSLVEIEHEDGIRSGYYHLLTSSIQVSVGDVVALGDRLGHPSCEHLRGGESPGAHVHVYFCAGAPQEEACLDDSAFLLAIHGVPLSGWQAESSERNYEGTMKRGDELKTAVNLRCDGSETASRECAGRTNDISAR